MWKLLPPFHSSFFFFSFLHISSKLKSNINFEGELSDMKYPSSSRISKLVIAATCWGANKSLECLFQGIALLVLLHELCTTVLHGTIYWSDLLEQDLHRSLPTKRPSHVSLVFPPDHGLGSIDKNRREEAVDEVVNFAYWSMCSHIWTITIYHKSSKFYSTTEFIKRSLVLTIMW